MSVDTQRAARTSTSLMVPDSPIWRLSIAQYHQMVQSGILTDDDPVELLEGWLVTKMPKNPPHRLATQLLREALAQLVPAGWYVDAQEPITTADSEPEPDVVIVRGDRRQYRDRHPGPDDVALVVEVSDSTLQRDRTTKQRLYATAGIVAYWIVNLVDGLVEVYQEPSGPASEPRFARRDDYRRGEHIPLTLDGAAIGAVDVEAVLA
ncbi:Uma2 family endonuclease [Oscillochloris sp. ZM17-4]|uniref:Uma2 family endonuclease n=1 Tax=Oscillochloris sp. ZM17-4 TaxID=2866714 RepID=UPI001C73451D|nr:Uma2 family endonuclease [Oscillochloris sp. ZM17-4]MBX0326132.1 Uma2 family endonuclease [Oscillochloris sp. ZM17-4]